VEKIVRPVLLIALLMQLGACNRPSHDQPDARQPDARQPDSRQQASAQAVRDDLGRSVRLTGTPQRIVSLAPSLTEMLFALGAGARVAGVTSFCDYPPEAASRPVVGDLVTPNIERILSLKPDLVLISVEGNSPRTFASLEELGIPLFVSNPRNIAGVYKSLRDIGMLLGTPQRARLLLDSLQREERRIRQSRGSAHPSVLMLLSLQPLMAAGRSTFIDEVISLAGGRNAAESLRGSYPTLNREQLLHMNPDLVLYPDDMGVDEAQVRTGFPEWSDLDAMKRGALYRIDADIYLRPGPRVFRAAALLQDLIARAGQTNGR